VAGWGWGKHSTVTAGKRLVAAGSGEIFDTSTLQRVGSVPKFEGAAWREERLFTVTAEAQRILVRRWNEKFFDDYSREFSGTFHGIFSFKGRVSIVYVNTNGKLAIENLDELN
jgi:hypothetical protein